MKEMQTKMMKELNTGGEKGQRNTGEEIPKNKQKNRRGAKERRELGRR